MPSIAKVFTSRQLGGRSACTSSSMTLLRGRPPHNQRSVHGHWSCVNALALSVDQQWLASGGDDERVLLWNMTDLVTSAEATPKPHVMETEHESNIFALAFNSTSVISGGNDRIIIQHDLHNGKAMNQWILPSTVHSLSCHPSADVLFACASEDGRVKVVDTRARTRLSDCLIALGDDDSCTSVQYSPSTDGRHLLVGAGSAAMLFDVRKCNTHLLSYGHEEDMHEWSMRRTLPLGMYARFDRGGQRVVTLRRLRDPIVFNTYDATPQHIFRSPTYINNVSQKAACFAGIDDEMIATGSSDWSVHLWGVSSSPSAFHHENINKCAPLGGTSLKTIISPLATLHGHHSLVNQVVYSHEHNVLLSAGVEKDIKMWSALPLVGAAPPTTRYMAHAGNDDIMRFPNEVEDEGPMLQQFDMLLRRSLRESVANENAGRKIEPNCSRAYMPDSRKCARRYLRDLAHPTLEPQFDDEVNVNEVLHQYDDPDRSYEDEEEDDSEGETEETSGYYGYGVQDDLSEGSEMSTSTSSFSSTSSPSTDSVHTIPVTYDVPSTDMYTLRPCLRSHKLGHYGRRCVVHPRPTTDDELSDDSVVSCPSTPRHHPRYVSTGIALQRINRHFMRGVTLDSDDEELQLDLNLHYFPIRALVYDGVTVDPTELVRRYRPRRSIRRRADSQPPAVRPPAPKRRATKRRRVLNDRVLAQNFRLRENFLQLARQRREDRLARARRQGKRNSHDDGYDETTMGTTKRRRLLALRRQAEED